MLVYLVHLALHTQGCPMLRFLVLTAVTVVLTGCPLGSSSTTDTPADDPFANYPEVEHAVGTVTIDAVRNGEPVYLLKPDAQPGTAYMPEDLPDAFQQEGLRVIFSGEIQPIPPGVRMRAPVIVLSDIRPAP